MKQIESKVKWTAIKNVHFTLAFLGNVSETQLGQIKEKCEQVAGSYSAFNLCLGNVGVFPPTGPARVVWLGTSQGAEHLSRLQEALVNAFEQLGLTLEKRAFVPHLTLGRVRQGVRLTGRIELEKCSLEGEKTTDVDAIHVVQSELTPQGSVYTVLHTCPLRKTP